MTRTTAHLLLLALLFGLAGCVNLGGGTEPSRHYLIPSLADQGVTPATQSPNGPRVTIMPVEAAAYLDRPQLVIRTRKDQLELAEYDRWAEPPADNLRRVLKENLELLATRAKITSSAADYRLTIELERLEGTEAGSLLQLTWRLNRRATGELVAQARFRQVEEVGGTEPARLVAGYGQSAEAFSREMAERLDRLSGE